MNLRYIHFIVGFFLILLGVKIAYAESIMIPQSDVMNKVIFDGKWTYFYEWKRSGLTDLSYNNSTAVELRQGCRQYNHMF